MANVDLHIAADVTLHVRQLRGRFIPIERDVPYLDDKRSYAVAVDSGEVAIDITTLNALMARSMGGDRSNVDRLKVSFKNGRLEQKGVIDSAVNIPFSATSQVSTTPDGRIRIHTQSMRGFGLPVKPMLKLFSIEMGDLVKVAAGAGVEVRGNDLIIDPARIVPPPALRGRLTAVRIEGNRLVQTFGPVSGSVLRTQTQSATLSPNHIYWRGSQLSFGKLTMTDTDLELVDADPKDPCPTTTICRAEPRRARLAVS